MAHVLNLDAVAGPSPRELVLDKVTYPVEEMTTDNFIETTKVAQALAEDPSLDKHIQATKEAICRSVPTLPIEKLGGLPLRKLQLISTFVRGDDVAEAVDSEKAQQPATPPDAGAEPDAGNATTGS